MKASLALAQHDSQFSKLGVLSCPPYTHLLQHGALQISISLQPSLSFLLISPNFLSPSQILSKTLPSPSQFSLIIWNPQKITILKHSLEQRYYLSVLLLLSRYYFIVVNYKALKEYILIQFSHRYGLVFWCSILGFGFFFFFFSVVYGYVA